MEPNAEKSSKVTDEENGSGKTTPKSGRSTPTLSGEEQKPGKVVVDDFEDDDSDDDDDYDDDDDDDDPEAGGKSVSSCSSCLKCTTLGGMFVLCECDVGKSWDKYQDKYPQAAGAPKASSKLRWVVGPYWNMLLMTYAVIITITVLVYFTVISSQDTLIVGIGLALSAVTLTFLSLTAFSDPGIFPRYTRPMARDWSYSNQAGSFRPPKVIYCRECRLLIDQYDHFCPWSGTVIGAKNITYFHTFVSALVLTMLYDAIIIIVALTMQEESEDSSTYTDSVADGLRDDAPLEMWFRYDTYDTDATMASAR